MKWAACLAVFSGCLFSGWTVYRRGRSRVNFFTGLLMFCGNLNVEIGFALTPLAQIIARYKDTYPSEFRTAVTAYARLLAEHTDVTYEKVNACLPSALSAAEKTAVADFFYNLGRAGSREEKDKTTTAAATFAAMKTDAEKYSTGKASIIFKVLIIIGIAGVILLL